MHGAQSTRRYDQRPNERETPLSEFSSRFIKWKARQLCAKPEFSYSDFDDLVSELTLHLLERLVYFSPRLGHENVFVVAIVERKVASVIKARRALKRGSGRHPRSLDSRNRSGLKLSDELSEDLLDGTRTGRPLADEQVVDLAIDLAEVLKELPPKLREAALRLKRQSTADAARAMRMPRSSFHELKLSLRRRFRRAGLDKYLD